MNGSANKGSSCLAITEKKAHIHRPGGCVGIFLHLFDWNRKLAKKKLFSKKLLMPARAKQAVKKFAGDEKMPKAKPHLIADESSAGFPNSMRNYSRSVNLEQKNELQSPSLVARLMGLESMPAVAIAKHSTTRCEDGYGRDCLHLEKGCEMQESRPRKVRKMGSFESTEVTKLQGKALQIINVSLPSRKHHHSKLDSLVKCPRLPTGKSSTRSRLIEAATKILEPGLQTTNSAKNALNYSRSMYNPPKYEIGTDRADDMSYSDQFNQFSHNVQGANAFNRQPYKSYGNVLDHVDLRSSGEEKPYVFVSSASEFFSASFEGSEFSNSRTNVASNEEDSELVYKKHRDKSLPSPTVSLKSHNRKCRVGSETGEERWPFSRRPCQPSSIAPKAYIQSQNQVAQGREGIPFRDRQSNLQSKRVLSAANAVNAEKGSLNKSLSGHTRPRVTTMADNFTSLTERKSCIRQDYTLAKLNTPVRKRTGFNGQAESTQYSTPGKQKNIRCDVLTAKEVRLNAPLANRSCVKSRSVSDKADGSKNILSFTFSSPLRQKSGISTELEESRSPKRKLMLDDGKTNLWKTLPFSGDALGALLEQKLKELTNQEEDEMAIGVPLPKRSTAMILQELISALTIEQLGPPDVKSLNGDAVLKAPVKTVETGLHFSHDVDHLSPGSVLEAAFSIDSGFSHCLEVDNSESKLASYCLDSSRYQLQPLNPDVDILDFSTSLKKSGYYENLTDLIDHISRVLKSLNHASSTLLGSKLTPVKEVILNAELLFGYTSQRDSRRTIDSITDPFFLNELESVATATFPSYMRSQIVEETKEGHLREFLIDIVIECLDTKYGRYCNLGYEDWRKLQFCMGSEFAIREVESEMRRWKHLVGKLPDEIIEREMSFSLGKWIDFECEAYETGAKISSDIVQVLVEEIVSEFCQ